MATILGGAKQQMKEKNKKKVKTWCGKILQFR
jgi:hypothetical protein